LDKKLREKASTEEENEGERKRHGKLKEERERS